MSRRRDILDRAAQLIEERGFGAISVQQIADELEFSKANFFHHMRSKEQLLYDIFVENLHFALGHVEDILVSSDPPPTKLRALIDFNARMLIERASIMLVWFKEKSHLTPAHAREVNKLEGKIHRMLTDFYRDGIERGYFRRVDPLVARVAMFGLCFQLTRAAGSIGRHEINEISVRLQDVACHGLMNRADR